ncbi:RusA family crossover junction endodeoxyribonuclease [Pseudomonas sp. MWU12-3103b]|uniref:RusA family crossover junction endodeoxyribonuclease n=1 Tax=Pseudomonas sp. MWU12-3103b TaxID=2928857 RepID=UPI001FFFAFAC|nr:RusA family crossover junction endodeoxyribonuclease [Pseudomonas sp. MWU12-3103b]
MSDLNPVAFVVPGEAVGKGRPRVRMLGAKPGKKPVPMLYTPAETKAYETLIGQHAATAMSGRDLIAGPVMVELKIIVSVAQSWSKKKRAEALAGDVKPTKKPDIDNVLKAICDGINGIVFKDDVQVTNVSMSKKFGETPGVMVRVVPLEGKPS